MAKHMSQLNLNSVFFFRFRFRSGHTAHHVMCSLVYVRFIYLYIHEHSCAMMIMNSSSKFISFFVDFNSKAGRYTNIWCDRLLCNMTTSITIFYFIRFFPLIRHVFLTWYFFFLANLKAIMYTLVVQYSNKFTKIFCGSISSYPIYKCRV